MLSYIPKNADGDGLRVHSRFLDEIMTTYIVRVDHDSPLHCQCAELDKLIDDAGNYLSEGQWLNKLNSRRQRIRGTRAVKNEAGEKELQVIGQKIYLPNVVFTLVRNHTPPGQPYNPYEADTYPELVRYLNHARMRDELPEISGHCDNVRSIHAL